MLSAANFLSLNHESRMQRTTRRSIIQNKIEIKKIKEQTIICEFNSQEMIVKHENMDITSVTCFSCDKFCKHQEILVFYLTKQNIYQIASKRKSTDFNEHNDKSSKKQKIENDENDPTSANVIKIIKKKQKVNFTDKQLKEIQEVEEVLRIDNLIRTAGKVSYENFHKHCAKVITENKNAIKMAYELTIEQADTDLWHLLRLGRITASRLYETARCTVKNGSLVDKYLGKSSGWSFMMMRGTVLEEFVFKEVQKEFPTLERCGLIMCHEKYPLFAASPDGLHEDFVLEIKCPGTPNTFQQYTNLDKLNKKYFTQIQFQMFVTEKKKALLAVAALDFESTRNIRKLWIKYDKDYIDQMIFDATEFYRNAIFPALKRKFLHSNE